MDPDSGLGNVSSFSAPSRRILFEGIFAGWFHREVEWNFSSYRSRGGSTGRGGVESFHLPFVEIVSRDIHHLDGWFAVIDSLCTLGFPSPEQLSQLCFNEVMSELLRPMLSTLVMGLHDSAG